MGAAEIWTRVKRVRVQNPQLTEQAADAMIMTVEKSIVLTLTEWS